MSNRSKTTKTGPRVASGASVPRPARRARRKTQNSRGNSSSLVAAASAASVISSVRSAVPFRFGSAPANDQYREGGMRLAGCVIPTGTYADVLLLPGSSVGGAQTGAFCTTSPSVAGAGSLKFVSPTAYGISSTSPSSTLFGGAVSAIAAYFRHYRFRRLWLMYECQQQTSDSADNSSSVSLQLSYDNDPNALYQNSGTSVAQAQMQGIRHVRFPSWTPQVAFKAVDETRSSPGDKLFRITGSGDGVTIASHASADIDLYFQGALGAVWSNTGTNTANTSPGRFSIEFELDLYGFSNTISSTLSLLDEKKKSDLQALSDYGRELQTRQMRVVSEVLDVKSEQPSLIDLSKPKVRCAPAGSDHDDWELLQIAKKLREDAARTSGGGDGKPRQTASVEVQRAH